MKVVAIIQARMGSTRLPGKVLRKLGDRSVLAHVVSRVQACPLVDAVVVATTTMAADAAIVEEAARLGVGCHRGSEDDVLGRYHAAAEATQADVIVRVTSDCPLFDAGVLTDMLTAFRSETPSPDYLSNTLDRTYPRGLDAEIFTKAALDRANLEAERPQEREHVTPYLYQHPEIFMLRSHRRAAPNLSDLRWTLDTEEDWQLISTIFEDLLPRGATFSTDDVLTLLEDRPALKTLNAHVEQKKVN